MSELRRLGALGVCTVIFVATASIVALVALRGVDSEAATAQSSESSYGELVALFADLRDFEQPPLVDGVADYSAGVIPVSLVRWELTGDDSQLRRMMASP